MNNRFRPKRGASQKVTLRHKINRIIKLRANLVPEITGELCRALRELASTANELADRLEAPTELPDVEVTNHWKEAYRNEAYIRRRKLGLHQRITAQGHDLF